MFSTTVSPARRQSRSSAARSASGAALAAVVAAALVGAPTALEAQADDWERGPSPGTISVDPRAGLAIPVADLDELAQTGASFGGGVALHMSRRIALRADAELQLLTGARTPPPENLLFADMTSLNLTGGLEVNLLEPDTRWTGSLSLGAGISTLETEDTTDDGAAPPVAADLTNFALRGGMRLGHQVGERLDVYLEPAVYLVVLDRDETRAFDAASAHVRPFDVGWTIPLQAGVRFHFR